MAREGLTGSRIRERRVIAGLKQADLARQIGISASYLNLIEHNRRRIGGKLLLDIAATLQVEPQALTEGAEAALIAALREAAEEVGVSSTETARADEFAGRFPAWADTLARTRGRVRALEETVEALTDRMAHDPHLAASMHELLSTAAAIRSTAAILAETETLQPEWRDRFHANINEDSRRLSDSAQSLVTYLDAEAEDNSRVGTPQEEVEAFLADHDFSFTALEGVDASDDIISEMINTSPHLGSQAARFIAQGVLHRIAQDAKILKLKVLRQHIETHGLDVLALLRATRVVPAVLLRRLAALPEIGAGLVACDRSGTVTFRKSVEGFTVPRHGACCPLWPLFAALSQPGTLVTDRITQLSRAQAPFDGIASAEIVTPHAYNAPPLSQAVMLLLPAQVGTGEGMPVGATCRVCSLEKCTARREPSILNTGV